MTLNTRNRTCLPKKILLRKTVLLTMWVKYLSKEGVSRSKSIKITLLRKKTSHLTLTKAPMAHKTRSKEQFMFRRYHFKITIWSLMAKDATKQHLVGLNVVYGKTLLKNYIKDPFLLETNLLWLHSTSLTIPILDTRYFRYASKL